MLYCFYIATLNPRATFDAVQIALNDLPTIYPLQVKVTSIGVSYRVVFPLEMGDVPSLVIISTGLATPYNATEMVKGVASGSKLAFELDGITTKYFDFVNDNITNEVLQKAFYDLFNIRCPPSLYDANTDPSIVYADEFETEHVYVDTSTITESAFCGHNSLSANGLVKLIANNTNPADYICFAYNIPIGTKIFMTYMIQGEENFLPDQTFQIELSLTADTHWHYICINLKDSTANMDFMYSSIQNFTIQYVIIQNMTYGGKIDTLTLRTSIPQGYEETNNIKSSDQSLWNDCTFPFIYKGRKYYKCILDENNLPICASASNKIYYCSKSSIEGVRRFYPKYKFLDDSLRIEHTKSNHTIDISFRYSDCSSPTLIKVFPDTVSFSVL